MNLLYDELAYPGPGDVHVLAGSRTRLEAGATQAEVMTCIREVWSD